MQAPMSAFRNVVEGDVKDGETERELDVLGRTIGLSEKGMRLLSDNPS